MYKLNCLWVQNYAQFHCLDLTCDWLILKFVSKFCLGGLGLCGLTVRLFEWFQWFRKVESASTTNNPLSVHFFNIPGCCAQGICQWSYQTGQDLWPGYCSGWRHQELHILFGLQKGLPWKTHWVFCSRAEHGRSGHGLCCSGPCHHLHQHICSILYTYLWSLKNGSGFADLSQLLWISLWRFNWYVSLK